MQTHNNHKSRSIYAINDQVEQPFDKTKSQRYKIILQIRVKSKQ